MKIKLITFFLFTIISCAQNVTISGIIKDSVTTESVFGANIYIDELKAETTSNEYGFYSLTVPSGNYLIRVSYLGFKTIEDTVLLTINSKKNYSIIANGKQLQEVIITNSKKNAQIKSTEMSVNKLSVQTIKQMPVVLGEVDVVKAILQLPGVTNAGEGQSGFNVRGGSADQNLILLDEATIYNSSHLFGFFSIFNADAIKDLKLYKAGIPARFGGRLSSVLDIYQKEGNKEKYKIAGGIGVISSRLMAEGPMQKGKSSFLVAARASYGHLLLKLSDNKNTASFYDLNTKINYKINNNNTLFISGYFGRDSFALSDAFVNTYGNSFVNLRWNHLFSDKIFSNLSIIYSDYNYGLKFAVLGFNWNSGIQNFNLKYDLKHYLGNQTKLTYGINAQYYNFNPGVIDAIDSNSGIHTKQLDKKFAFEPALYLDVDQKISKRVAINYGLRYSMFYRLGNQKVNVYLDNQAVVFNPLFGIYEKATPIGVQDYGKNQIINSFNNLEPRVAISYLINNNQSIKASYNRMVQYLHLISNTQSPTPLDIWAPSDNFFKPQVLDQVAFGYFNNFKNDKYSIEIETYCKTIKNRVDYIDGAELIANNAIEQIILNGKARSYGLEIMFKKSEGKLSGWIAYTLSRTEQQTIGRTSIETGINNGQWYKSNYDKLHNLSITANYMHNQKWSFGYIFSLQSGQPATFPNGQYEYAGIIIPSFGLRNQDRLPIYHHLDVSATYIPKSNKQKSWQSEWVFSIYNIYNRQNAKAINFRKNTDTGANEAVKLSIFGIVPSITYNFNF